MRGAEVSQVPPPLAIGTVELESGELCKGFVCEGYVAFGGKRMADEDGLPIYEPAPTVLRG